MDEFDLECLRAAFEKLMAVDVDYDAHKFIKYGEEEDHVDQYPELTDKLVTYYVDFLRNGVPPEED